MICSLPSACIYKKYEFFISSSLYFLYLFEKSVIQISVPEEFTVVMSALPSGQTKTDKNKKKTYQFSQTLPVPAYLIAIAVGNLSYQRIGPRSTVWTEPELLDQAVYEFDEVFCLLLMYLFSSTIK